METAIKILLERLENINFCLIGSYNLFLQGIEIVPNDLDLLTDDEGIKKISQIFDTQINNYDGYNYKETQFDLGNTDVHVVSNKNNPLRPCDFMKEVVIIDKYGLKIPCMSLKSELIFYRQVNREKDKQKVKLLEEFLNKQ